MARRLSSATKPSHQPNHTGPPARPPSAQRCPANDEVRGPPRRTLSSPLPQSLPTSSSQITSRFSSTLLFHEEKAGILLIALLAVSVCVCVCVWACKCVTFIPSVTAHVCLLMGFNKVQISVNQWQCTAYASSHEMINRCNTMKTTRGHKFVVIKNII